MNLPVVFRRAARDEYDQAFAWHEGQRTGPGREFEESGPPAAEVQ